MAAASGKSEHYQHDHPGRRRAVHRERINRTGRPGVKPEQINRTDTDKNVQPQREQAGAEGSEARCPEEKVCITSAVGKQIGTALLLGRFVLVVTTACA